MKLRSGVLAGLLLLGLAGPQAHAADDYPTRQIKIIVPFPAGAGPDQVARILGQRLQEELGQADVIAGVIDLAFADFSVAIPQMLGGTLRGIGVTSPKRNELPDLPPLAEAMPGFEATIWYGLLAPANTPEAVVSKLYATSEKILS